MSQTRIIIAALVTLGALFVGFAWWVWAKSTDLSVLVPAGASALTVLLALLVIVIPRLQARRGARELEKALRAPSAGPEARSPEIDRMRKEFEEAVQALKNSRLRGKGLNSQDALGVLPWYAIIGPPACGKTTALRESGLRFPHLKGTGKRPNVKGINGTYNLDWFLTDEAILIDTAGRWTVEGSATDRQEWQAFLGLLRKHRPDKPLNGIIVAVSLAEDLQSGAAASVDDSPSILGLGETEVRLLADRMRERVEEIASELGVRLPVYVLFTKCDLLSGFSEMFGTMNEAQRRQLWGFNTRVGEASIDPTGYFSTCFDELCRQLESRAVLRMTEETQPEVLERIFGFPDQFRALGKKLGIYVEGLLHDSAFSESPMLRGVYFTCGTQEGAPAQATTDALAAALRIEERIEVGESHDESYFLYDMLRKVVFEDRHLAAASDAELTRRKRARRIWMTSTMAASAVALLLSITSYTVNRGLLERTAALLPQTQRQSADDLWPLYEETTSLERGRPTLLASGFYQGNYINGPLREHFAKELQRLIVRDLYGDNTAILKQTVNALDRGDDVKPSPRDRETLSNALELHLLLGQRDGGQNKDCAVPSPVTEGPRIVAQLSEFWEKRSPADSGERKQRRVAMLEKYLALLSPRPDELNTQLAFNTERAYVPRARRVLGSDDSVERALAGISARYEAKAVVVGTIADPGAFQSREAVISGEYSKAAWQQIERELADGRLWESADSADCWVLGTRPASADQRNEKLGAELRQRYQERYAATWQRFVSGLSSRTPSNLPDADTLLRYLPRQLEVLFQNVKAETTPPPPPPSATELVKNNLPGADKVMAAAGLHKPSVNAFASLATFTRFGVPEVAGTPAPLDSFRTQLEPVLAALSAYRMDPARIADVKTATEGTLNALRPSLIGYGTFRNTLEQLMVRPLEITLDFATGGGEVFSQDSLQQAFCTEVYAPYREQLGGRFPFKRDFGTGVRAEDLAKGGTASLDAITALLQPKQGKLWAFVEQQLSGYVVSEGNGYRFGTRDGRGGASVLREDVLRFLKRARRLSDALFAGGSQVPRFRFEAVLRNGTGISKSRLLLGGEEVARYDNGELTTVSLEWPGKDPAAGIELQLELDDRSRATPTRMPGPWGLFLWLDGTGCRDVQGAACTMSGRCDAQCSWYGAGSATAAMRACGGQACYWGLNAGTRAQIQERVVSLSIPVGNKNINAKVQLRDVDDAAMLSDPTLFDLRMPSRITNRSTSSCIGE